jgi:drug/metabolite transporter (DMT)-like permease
MNFYIFAWIATLTYAVVAIASKLVSKYSIKNPWLMNFLWSLFIAIDLLIVGVIINVGSPVSWKSVLITGFYNALFGIFYVLSLYKIDISVLSPLSNLRTAVTTLLSVLIIGETITGNQIFLITLIVIAGVLVTYDEKLKLKSLFKPEMGMVMLFILFASLWSISIKKSIAEVGYWQTSIWSYVISVLFILPTTILFKKDVSSIKAKQIGITFLLAIGSVLGAIFSFKALQMNVSISSTIINLPLSVLAAFAFSLIAPKLLEKHSVGIYVIRLSAAIVMIISALKLSH